MSDYGIMLPDFWTGSTGRANRGDALAQVVAAYLGANHRAEMTGLYRVDLRAIADETGHAEAEVDAAISRLEGRGYCHYDRERGVVFVVEMARVRLGKRLSAGDRRRKKVAGLIDSFADHPFAKLWVNRYRGPYKLDGCEHFADVLTEILDGRFTVSGEPVSDSVSEKLDGASNGASHAPCYDLLCSDLDLGRSGSDPPDRLDPPGPDQPVKRGVERPEVAAFERQWQAEPHPLPGNWRPTDEQAQRAKAAGVDLDLCAGKFRAHHKARGIPLRDWSAEFEKWLLEDIARGKRNPQAPKPDPAHPRPTREQIQAAYDRDEREREAKLAAARKRRGAVTPKQARDILRAAQGGDA